MARQDFYDAFVEISGNEESLAEFAQHNLLEGEFSFDSILPMPMELAIERNNFVEDGFDALFGDWTSLAGRWMFKDAASKLCFPFPLENRAQVIECLRFMGEDGEKCLALGIRYRSNLDRFGCGDAVEWRKANWGIECDTDEVSADVLPEKIRISFSICAPFPKKMAILLSRAYPDLSFLIAYVNDSRTRAKKWKMSKGKEIEKFIASAEEIGASMYDCRRLMGTKWLAHYVPAQSVIDHLEMGERGRVVFKGTKISVDFALRQLKNGETSKGLGQRFPELTEDHLQTLSILAARRNDC